MGEGLAGSIVTVNGRPAPETHVFPPRARVRLRLANLATSRLMPLLFEGVQPSVLAVDGQDCPIFEPLRNILPLAPGGRFDVYFDMPEQEGASARIALLGSKPEGGADGGLLLFKAEGRPVSARPPLGDPAPNRLLPAMIALQKAHRAKLVFDARSAGEPASLCSNRPPQVWYVNGKPGGLTPLFSVRRGTPVSLGLTNKSETHIVIRLHGHVMRQLHLMDDGWDPYWRDAVVVPAGRTVRVAFVADNPGRWLIGGGILPHAVGGQSGVFTVT
jgi:FtsP/CotA-like multicopper oxidase with cupredoxin domain